MVVIQDSALTMIGDFYHFHLLGGFPET